MGNIQIVYGDNVGSTFNAGSKAVNDAIKIAKESGYSRIFKINKSQNKARRIISFLLGISRNLFFKKNFFIQYPITSTPAIDKLITTLLFKILKKNVTILVHDLNSYRFTGSINSTEIEVLKNSNQLVVHTQLMKEFLKANGISDENMNVLGPFPYLIEKSNQIDRLNCNEVVFAGNLDKSEFLVPLSKLAMGNNVKFNLYGSETTKISYNDFFKYKGRFFPDDVSNLKGKWGLVWDGNCIETCSGHLGNYMKINSPHKVSLYIAAELPIIIWSGSALANFILKNNIGIVIDSLNDLPMALSNTTMSQYETILQNIKKYSAKVRSGEILESILENYV